MDFLTVLLLDGDVLTSGVLMMLRLMMMILFVMGVLLMMMLNVMGILLMLMLNVMGILLVMMRNDGYWTRRMIHVVVRTILTMMTISGEQV